VNNERLASDPSMSVNADGPDHVVIVIGNTHLRMSRFNARRVFVGLSLVLELPLSAKVARQIRM
jgi:hypothetical protein